LYSSYKFRYKAALSFLGIIDVSSGQILRVSKGYPANVGDEQIFQCEGTEKLLIAHNKFMLADSGFHSPRCVRNQSVRWAVEAVFGWWKRHFEAFHVSRRNTTFHNLVAQVSAWLLNVKMFSHPVEATRLDALHDLRQLLLE